MVATFRGYKIYEQEGVWYFRDTKDLVSTTWESRPCGFCGKANTPDGHDGCIGHLPGVMNACCGHGEPSAAYIQFADGAIIQRHHAIEKMKK